MTRLRSAVPLSLLLTVAFVAAGCGGSDSEVSSSTDVNELLTKTFTGSKKVESGNLDVSIKIAAEGGESQIEGPVNLSLSGPFQTQDGGNLPEFKLEAAFEGAGQSIKAGATSTPPVILIVSSSPTLASPSFFGLVSHLRGSIPSEAKLWSCSEPSFWACSKPALNCRKIWSSTT